MKVKRVVSTSLWDDELVSEKFTPEDKYFMVYLLTNRYTTQLGIYRFPVKNVAVDMGYSVDSINSLLERFQNRYGIIAYSTETNEIAILNYLRYSIVRGGRPVLDCLIKEYNEVKDKYLVDIVINHLSNYEIDNDTVNEFISLITNKENENDNNNDNDNEESYHDSSPVAKKPVKSRVLKNSFGESGNVKLTDVEYNRLANDFGVEIRDKAIEYLDSYMAEKEYDTKDHNRTIRRWVIDAVNRNASKNATKHERYINEWKDA